MTDRELNEVLEKFDLREIRYLYSELGFDLDESPSKEQIISLMLNRQNVQKVKGLVVPLVSIRKKLEANYTIKGFKGVM